MPSAQRDDQTFLGDSRNPAPADTLDAPRMSSATRHQQLADPSVGYRVPTPPLDARAEVVAAAVKTWVGQLVDLTGRNPLLYYRNLKRGTLDLARAESSAVRSAQTGKKVHIATLFPATDEDPNRLDQTLKNARTIYGRARALFEERGIETLFITRGMASWKADKTTATPAAPLFMAPIDLEPFGAGQTDFTAQISGEWRINDTLIHYLRETLGVTHDPSSLLDTFHDAQSYDEAARAVSAACGSVPEFTVVDRSVIGTFQYTKLPMVRDLERNLDVIADSDLVAAMAGYEPARDSIRRSRADIHESAPDFVPPRDEFLVLDADSSQSYAINAVVAGESLVIQGPPGTGKSQTIANVIASLVARDKTVLFVAEKRAAIDAVVKRLSAVGLDDAVLDLHGGIASRKNLAEALAQSLDRVKSMPAVTTDTIDHALTSCRSDLVEHANQLHRKHPVWGISVFDAYSAIAGLPSQSENDIIFTGPALTALDTATRRAARDNLEEWSLLREPLRANRTPWSHTSIQTQESAQRAIAAATEVGEVAGSTSHSLDRVAADLGIDPPTTLGGWDGTLDMLVDVATLLDVYQSDLLALDQTELTELQTALAPAATSLIERAWAQLFRSDFRRALDAVRSLRTDGTRVKARQSFEDISLAVSVRSRWAQCGADRLPRVPTNLHEVVSSAEDLRSRLETLGEFFTDDPGSKPDRTPVVGPPVMRVLLGGWSAIVGRTRLG